VQVRHALFDFVDVNRHWSFQVIIIRILLLFPSNLVAESEDVILRLVLLF